MSIGSIGSASNPQQSNQNNWQNVLNAASATLGLTGPALQQQLQSGSSLSSIAQSQGVSQQTLVSSISSALTQNGSTATGSQLQQMATSIANRTPGGHHHHHHGGGSTSDATDGSSSADATSATSSTDDPLMAALTAASSSSSSSPFEDLSDPSSSSASGSGLANAAAESDLWQGIDLKA
jgi:hypothetical protein